jgi:hypothetical protein
LRAGSRDGSGKRLISGKGRELGLVGPSPGRANSSWPVRTSYRPD